MNYNNKAIITSIQRYCLDDGPGIRTTVFMKGCPLRCVWCHNPETHIAGRELMQKEHRCTGCQKCIPECPSGARTFCLEDGTPKIIVDRNICMSCGKCVDVCPNSACEICGKEMSVEDIISEVERDKIFYKSSGGGMTVSGGECASHPDFTLALIKEALSRGISCAIETCGFGDASFFKKAAELGVLFLYDIKEMDAEKHKALTGARNDIIFSNLKLLMEMKAEIIIRMPLIPGINDSDEELASLAEFLLQNKNGYTYAQIMPYHSLGNGKSISLGKEVFSVDEALSANDCEACRDRWKEAFTKRGIDVIMS